MKKRILLVLNQSPETRHTFEHIFTLRKDIECTTVHTAYDGLVTWDTKGPFDLLLVLLETFYGRDPENELKADTDFMKTMQYENVAGANFLRCIRQRCGGKLPPTHLITYRIKTELTLGRLGCHRHSIIDQFPWISKETCVHDLPVDPAVLTELICEDLGIPSNDCRSAWQTDPEIVLSSLPSVSIFRRRGKIKHGQLFTSKRLREKYT